MPFKEQVKLFNNAKLIILAHGAAMSNIFFCKKGTTIIEVTCNTKWEFFDNISSILNLNHIKIDDNNIDTIINTLSAQ
jgi:capsular polysaccharide biosynthesis protein